MSRGAWTGGCRLQGFTLLEVIVVLVILGILAAIAVPRLAVPDIEEATDALIADLRQARTLAQTCYQPGGAAFNLGSSWGIDSECVASDFASAPYFEDGGDFDVELDSDGHDNVYFCYPDGLVYFDSQRRDDCPSEGESGCVTVSDGNGQERYIEITRDGVISRSEKGC